MGITDLMVGGMGTLGQGVGAGVDGYLTQRDYDGLSSIPQDGAGQAGGAGDPQQDPFVRQIMDLAKQGVDPLSAVQMVKQQRLGARPVQQPNVVPGTIGSSSTMGMAPSPGAGMGTLGAPPQQMAPPPQAAPMAPQMRSAPPPGISGEVPGMGSYGRPVALPPRTEMPAAPPPQAAPQMAPPQAQGTQPSRPPPAAPTGQLSSFGVSGRITPRNMPLAQLMIQQRQREAAGEQRLAAIERQLASKEKIAGNAEQGRNDREGRKIASREAIAQLGSDTMTQLGQLRNDTDVFGIMTAFKARAMAIGQQAVEAGNELEFKREKEGQRSQILDVAQKVYNATIAATANMPAELQQKAQSEARAQYNSILEALGGPRIIDGQVTTTVTPGVFSDKTTTTQGPPTAVMPNGGKPPAPKPPGGSSGKKQRKIIKTQVNKVTGQKRVQYDDGTTEVL